MPVRSSHTLETVDARARGTHMTHNRNNKNEELLIKLWNGTYLTKAENANIHILDIAYIFHVYRRASIRPVGLRNNRNIPIDCQIDVLQLLLRAASAWPVITTRELRRISNILIYGLSCVTFGSANIKTKRRHLMFFFLSPYLLASIALLCMFDFNIGCELA